MIKKLLGVNSNIKHGEARHGAAGSGRARHGVATRGGVRFGGAG